MYKWLQTDAKERKHVQTIAGGRKRMQTDANGCKRMQTGANGCVRLHPFATVCERLHPFASVCIRLHPFAPVCSRLRPCAPVCTRLHPCASVCNRLHHDCIFLYRKVSQVVNNQMAHSPISISIALLLIWFLLAQICFRLVSSAWICFRFHRVFAFALVAVCLHLFALVHPFGTVCNSLQPFA